MNTTKFFDTKERHLAFRNTFKKAVNNPRAKKGKPDANGYREKGWIRAAHMMLQNIVRGNPYDRGFTPITKQVRLDNGACSTEAVINAKWYLQRHIDDAKAYVKAEPAQLSHWELPKRSSSLSDMWKSTKTKEQENSEYQAAIHKLIVAKTANQQAQLLKRVSAFLEPFGEAFSIQDLARVEIKEVKDESNIDIAA